MSMAASPFHCKNKPAIVVMGVCGCGKSTIGKKLAEMCSLPFREGDDFHPPTNIAKMAKAIPLDDEDRWPWLERLGTEIHHICAEKGGVITSCSALKRAYRERLAHAANTPVHFIFLTGTRETLIQRMQSRTNHYMPISLLDSQLQTLEIPQADETALIVSIEQPIDQIIQTIVNALPTLHPSTHVLSQSDHDDSFTLSPFGSGI